MEGSVFIVLQSTTNCARLPVSKKAMIFSFDFDPNQLYNFSFTFIINKQRYFPEFSQTTG